MFYQFTKCTYEAVEHLVINNLASISSPFDSFLEAHILSSQFYQIENREEKAVGYFSLLNHTITQFYIEKPYLNEAQALFQIIKKQFGAKEALVSTSDELLLCLAIDQFTHIEPLAYIYTDSEEKELQFLSEDVYFRLANGSDLPIIIELCEPSIDIEDQIDHDNVYLLLEDDHLKGFGILQVGRLLKNYVTFKVYTNKTFCEQGIGTRIIRNLKRECYRNKKIPISSCCYNIEDHKKSLEDAGMVSKTRILSIAFE